MAIPACGATWDTDFDDTYYGIQARCDQPAHHPDEHSGPIVWWEGGGDMTPQDGMRLSWPPGKDGPDR